MSGSLVAFGVTVSAQLVQRSRSFIRTLDYTRGFLFHTRCHLQYVQRCDFTLLLAILTAAVYGAKHARDFPNSTRRARAVYLDRPKSIVQRSIIALCILLLR